ncbi:MAG: MBL fold metallo-hydrolase [Sphingomonadales bacterium]|nr:MBL fold metallo-hydrolase [Sphingomonadales bacterium]
MTRRLNWTIAILLLVIGVPYYWFLLDNRPGNAIAKPVTIGQLRTLAEAKPGPHPSGVEMELVGWSDVPGDLFAAGSGLMREQIGIMAFRLPVPGDRPIVIDSGLTAADAEEIGLDTWLGAEQAKVDQAMSEAGLILLTHEHPDHMGGLLGWARDATFARATLNGPQKIEAGRRLGISVDGAETKATGQPYAIAPGVVVIPAPSHTPGSQMIFVRLGSGAEFLFAGDIATMEPSWRELRARSRLVGTMLSPEDRPEVYSWLKTIQALKAAAPNMAIIPGHDVKSVLAIEQPAKIRSGFNLSQINAIRR